jgi:type II secretory pathway pseudopilin PulG
MTQPSMPAPAVATAYPTVCGACGGRLLGPVTHCPRCGAAITARGAKRSSSVALLVVLGAVVLLGLPCAGILAAIAIPNFLRYQLRAKQAEVTHHLRALVEAEQAAQAAGGFVPFEPFPAGTPGERKRELSAEERELATRLGWTGEPRTYGQYRIAIAGPGGQVAALCAESDLDGDGVPALHVAFLVLDGADPGLLPPAPCSTPVPYEPHFGLGQVAEVSGRETF